MEFVHRATELHELDAAARHRDLPVVFGRRRVGKTARRAAEGQA